MGGGGAVTLPASVYGSPKLGTFSCTLGARSEQNPYSGELVATERALKRCQRLSLAVSCYQRATRRPFLHFGNLGSNLANSISAASTDPSEYYGEVEAE